MRLLKKYITQLKNSYVYKLLLNNYFLIAISIVLSLISLTNYICVIVLFVYYLYIYRKSKIIFNICVFLSLITLGFFIFLNNTYSYLDLEEISGEVIDIENSDDGKKITIKNKNKKYIIYDYNDYIINYGDYIEVKGKTLRAETARVRNGFDYSIYLKHNRIYSTILSSEIRIVDYKFNLGIIKHYFKLYLKNTFSEDSYTFLKAMIIGDLDDIDEDFKNAIMDNGILHLFAVSGLHIVLFIGLIEKFLKFLKLKQNKIDLINSIFLLIYLIITSFSPSVLRASMMYYISLVNKKLKLGLSTLDVISIIFINLIIHNPLYYYNLGFNLSFISSTIIVLTGDLFKKYNKYIQVLLISFFANLITFPLVININGKINLLSPFSNVIFIELVETIVLPISFFILVFPIFKSFYRLLIIGFNKITTLFSEYFVINVRFPFMNNYLIILYFLLLFLLLKIYYQKRLRYALSIGIVLFLFIFNNSTYIIPKTEIHFLDLKNGEASLIIDSKNECYALIDTGDGANHEVTSYLKKEGIEKLNYLILTHNHIDHNGEVKSILKEIKVNNLVLSAYDNSVTNNFFENKERFANIIKVKAGDELTCGRNTFLILHPNTDYPNENDNSIVIYSRIGGLYFLFLGDVTKAIEEGTVANYNLQVDVLKIAHHGSSTSTSAYLIEKLHPKYAIIMAGRVDKFAFPHSPTIEVLDKYNVKTYRTDINYSIIYKYKKNKSIFVTIK